METAKRNAAANRDYWIEAGEPEAASWYSTALEGRKAYEIRVHEHNELISPTDPDLRLS